MFKLKNVHLKSHIYNIIYSIIIMLVFNIPFFNTALDISGSKIFSVALYLVVFCTFVIVTNLIFIKCLVKPLSILLLVLGSVSLYFMVTYKIVIDKIMLINAIQTDIYEVGDLLNWRMLVFFVLTCVLPVLLILKTNIVFGAPKSKIITMVVSALVAFGIVLSNFGAFNQFIRQHKYVKNSLIPVNYIGAIISVVKIELKSQRYTEIKKISEDAKLNHQGNKPNLIIAVIGESARTANFSLFGYERDTNKALTEEKDELVLFKNFASCGTATAVSLPCIFSPYERIKFKPESGKYTENLLDIFETAGYNVIWRENNTGCKDNCDRVEIEKACRQKECSDQILLQNLAEKIKKSEKPVVMVMHQRGSHGPKYYTRYSKEEETYAPSCTDEILKNCDRQALINAYDNTIYQTSVMLDKLIKELKNLENDYNIALLFTSDHGESLGENGMYLHSAYYDTAPSTQTNVPTFLWFSDGYIKDNNINLDCLKNLYETKLSHDNVFHTLMSMANVESPYYKPDLDILEMCRPAPQ